MRKEALGSLAALVAGAGLLTAADPPLHQAVFLQRPVSTEPSASVWSPVVQTSAVVSTPLAQVPPSPFPPPAVVQRGAMEAPPAPPPGPPVSGGLPPVPPGTSPPPVPGPPPSNGFFSRLTCPDVICEPRFWVSGEYLMWWVKNGPVPVPLVATGPLGGPTPGQVLFGDGNINYGMFSGLRITAGAWLDPGQNFGLEGSGFGLFNNSRTFQFSSSAAGTPPVVVPVNSAVAVPPFFPAGPTAIGSNLLAPLGLPTYVNDSSSSQFWGWEVDGVINLARAGIFHAEGLVGFRYLNLTEDLNLQLSTTGPPGFFPPDLMFSQPATAASLTDGFSTRNQFYGANFGVRGGVRYGRVSLDGTFKLAMGPIYEVEQVVGFKSAVASSSGFVAGATAPGGIFAQPSNSGRRTDTTFAVVPEVIVQLGIDVTKHWRVFVGYNFLYLSDVIRPGSQIDGTVNLTQLTGIGLPPGSPARPASQFNHTDFWTQGINFGAEFRW